MELDLELASTRIWQIKNGNNRILEWDIFKTKISGYKQRRIRQMIKNLKIKHTNKTKNQW